MRKEPQNLHTEAIIRKLRNYGALSSRELQITTSLSQPQLSRYLRLLGSQIITIGKGRKTLYAYRRIITNVGQIIPVYQVTLEGQLTEAGNLHAIYPKGFFWEAKKIQLSRIFEDLPYFLNDIRPSGYLGRLIPFTYPDWEFPEDIRFWSAEVTLNYLTHFGIDLIGNLIVGEAAAKKFLELRLKHSKLPSTESSLDNYTKLAKLVEQSGIPGSSAGGEHPKFVSKRPSDGRDVIVKFVKNAANQITQRRVDLLRAEKIALAILSHSSDSQPATLLSNSEYTFLEVIRFDRTANWGRRGVISLLSLDAELIGSAENWSKVAQNLCKNKLISADLLEQIQLQEYFGHFIGNTDMHNGNLSFFFEDEEISGLTPIYDMLPMKYAPIHEHISDETLVPFMPNPSSITSWNQARKLAIKYWNEITKTPGFSENFIDLASRNEAALLAIDSAD
jgi:hypothetical protein